MYNKHTAMIADHQSFKKPGRYSFIFPNKRNSPEVEELPTRLLEEKITIVSMCRGH